MDAPSWGVPRLLSTARGGENNRAWGGLWLCDPNRERPPHLHPFAQSGRSSGLRTPRPIWSNAMEVDLGDARGRGMRWVEVALVLTSPPEVTGVFGACRGASRPVLGPKLRATKRPETQVLPRFPASAPPGSRTPNLLIKSSFAGYTLSASELS